MDALLVICLGVMVGLGITIAIAALANLPLHRRRNWTPQRSYHRDIDWS